MLIASFNVRRLGRDPKRAALKRFLESESPAMILLQETMVSAVVVVSFFLRMKPSWHVCALDACGLSGGTLVARDPRLADFTSFASVAGILV